MLSLALNLVWCPKYWRQILGGGVADELRELTEQIADEDGRQIVANEIMRGQVHLFMRVGVADVPASVGQAFKDRTAQVVRQKFPQPRNHPKVLWSPSYLAASVAHVPESTKRCAANQSDAAAS